MTVLTRTPANTNYLQPTKFLLVFDRIPNIQYFCQAVNIPGVNGGQTPISFPTIDVFSPGNKLTYNNFNVTFTVDEALLTWQEMYNWFRSFASPDGFEERNRLTAIQNSYKSQGFKQMSDATLTILNNLNNPTIRVQFANMFPVSLSDLQFDTKMSADDIITADVTFVYEQFTFVQV
jgi:hypothetical protein